MSSPSKGWQHDLPGSIYRAEVVGLGWWTTMRGCRVRGWAIRSGLIPVNISPLYRQRISSFSSEMMWAEALASSLRVSLSQAQHSLYNYLQKALVCAAPTEATSWIFSPRVLSPHPSFTRTWNVLFRFSYQKCVSLTLFWNCLLFLITTYLETMESHL